MTGRRMLSSLGLGTLVALLALLGWGLLRPGAGGGGLGVNAQGGAALVTRRPAPEIRLQLFDSAGTAWRLADYREQRVVVNFWASWCAPCRTEAGMLAQAARDYQGQRVAFVGVNLWDDDGAARRFLAEFGVTYPNGRDVGGNVGVDYGVTGIPETFIVDAHGALVRHWIGPLTRPQLDGLLSP